LLECTNRLRAHGKTIADATDFLIQHLMANEKSCTARELVDEFVAAKQKEAASQFDLDDIRSRLTTFSQRFGNHLVETITSAQIDDWLRSLNVSIVTRNHYRRLIMLAFNFAVQRGYTNSNPVFGRFVVSRAGNC
jgi:dsRNA-specific ribonuclease